MSATQRAVVGVAVMVDRKKEESRYPLDQIPCCACLLDGGSNLNKRPWAVATLKSAGIVYFELESMSCGMNPKIPVRRAVLIVGYIV